MTVKEAIEYLSQQDPEAELIMYALDGNSDDYFLVHEFRDAVYYTDEKGFPVLYWSDEEREDLKPCVTIRAWT